MKLPRDLSGADLVKVLCKRYIWSANCNRCHGGVLRSSSIKTRSASGLVSGDCVLTRKRFPRAALNANRDLVTASKQVPYRGDHVSVDQNIAVEAATELENVMANLELMPSRMNSGKGEKIGPRQRSLAEQLHMAGLLSAEGLARVRGR